MAAQNSRKKSLSPSRIPIPTFGFFLGGVFQRLYSNRPATLTADTTLSGTVVPGGTARPFVTSGGTDHGPLAGNAPVSTSSVRRPALTTRTKARPTRIGFSFPIVGSLRSSSNGPNCHVKPPLAVMASRARRSGLCSSPMG